MNSFFSNRFRRVYSKAVRSMATQAAIEALEIRVLMSSNALTAQFLEGPVTRAGSIWSYDYVYKGTPPPNDVTSEVDTIIGPATFNGMSLTEVDQVDTRESAATPPVETQSTAKIYYAFTKDGLVSFGFDGPIISTPFATLLPATMVPGQSYASDFTESTPSSDVTTSTHLVIELIPGDPTPITVGGQTYQCYEVDNTRTTTVSSTGAVSGPTLKREFFAPGVGEVEEIHNSGTADEVDIELGSMQTSTRKLAFLQGPTAAEEGNAIKPPITVQILDGSGALDSTGGDSTDNVTLTITDGTALGGTTTVAAIAGVATFTNISVGTAGSYTLKATSDSPLTSATSGSFDVTAGNPSDLTPTLSRLKVPVTAVGGSNAKGSATLDVTNSSDADVSGAVTVNTFLSINTTLDTSALKIGNTFTKSVKIKVGKSTNLTVPIGVLPQVPAAGDYHILFQITDTHGNSSLIASDNTVAVGPATVALTETVTAVKLPAAVVSGEPVKGGASVALTITNNGNIVSKGITSINVTASTTADVLGTTIATLSKSLTIQPGKSLKVVIPIKDIPRLADGNYFIVVQVTDPFAAGTSIASSGTTTNIAAGFIALVAVLGPVTTLKAGDTLTLTNNGNQDDNGTFTATIGFSLDAQGTQVVGQTASAGKVFRIKAGKFIKVHSADWAKITSGLTSGVTYFLTVSVIDSTNNTAFAVSTTSFTL